MDYTYYDSNLHENQPTEKCIPVPRYNGTLITDAYAGIPQNILLNLIGFLFLVILFGLLRKKAWNYGRLALLNTPEEGWTELFYGDNEARDTDAICVESSVNSHLSQVDRGFLSWIITAFRITDEELLQRAGPDGLLYISFERYLIILMSLMVTISLCIALPINFHGNMQGDNATFGHTTLSNLDPMSAWIWVHSVLLLFYLPVGGYIMRNFLRKVRESRYANELAARTLLISEIPKHQCNVETLTNYFKEAFPALTVEEVTLAYDTRRLAILDMKRECAEQARLYCENYAKKRPPLEMYPHPCGQVIGCCCRNKVNAQEFYMYEEMRLTALVKEAKKVALSKPLGVAFVTLGTPSAAKTMKKELSALPSLKWVVNYAPIPSDIFWENLSIPRPYWYLNAILINFALGIVLFFLTTPAVIVSALNKLPITGEIMNLSPVVSSFLPTVLLVSVAALMPVLVARSESLVRHWTRSSLNRAAFLEWTVNAKNDTGRWDCVFLPDQGALFVNYVITAALLGTGLELVRFPELAIYTLRLCLARSRAERIHVRKAVLWEFPLVKHLVDRHNLCFAYGPNIGGGQLAGAAASATGAAPILAQAALLALGLVRRGLSPLAAIQLTGLVASILGLLTGATLFRIKSKIQTQKRDFTAGHNFVAPMLRNTQSLEETISTSSNCDVNLSN
ncbi:CSC1-like protein 2 [Anthophora retusa]